MKLIRTLCGAGRDAFVNGIRSLLANWTCSIVKYYIVRVREDS
jgi:hypothetical protein